uniref:Uncharacterized protein n=1 Tax=Ciona intestinalis TaxID=7719 RepID=H2XZB4_CIOIN
MKSLCRIPSGPGADVGIDFLTSLTSSATIGSTNSYIGPLLVQVASCQAPTISLGTFARTAAEHVQMGALNHPILSPLL